MTVPQSYIAFAPFGVGVMCASTYFERGADVYGWWIGARDTEYYPAYFRLERFFTSKPTRLYATEGSDQSHPVWIHRSGGFQADVLRTLQRYWPLDYQ
jgi:hypothetical protein